MDWPRATAVDLMLVTASSSWLRLISNPLALTIGTSGKRSLGFEAGDALVEPAGAGAAHTVPTLNKRNKSLTTKDPKRFLININDYFTINLQFYHLYITNIRIALEFVEDLLRRH